MRLPCPVAHSPRTSWRRSSRAMGLAHEHFFVLAVESGHDRGELLGLRREHVDLEARTIFIDQQVAEAPPGSPRNGR